MSLGATKASGGGSTGNSNNSASSKGGKGGGGKHNTNHVSSHNHHASNKNTDKAHKSHTAVAATTDTEDAGGFQKKVQDLMEMTRRSEAEVCSALHDCDNDLEKACDMLFEEADKTQGQWQTKEKKKKKSGGVNASGAGGGTSGAAGGGSSGNNNSTVGGGEEDWGAMDGGQPRDNRPPRGRSSFRPWRRGGPMVRGGRGGGGGGRGGRGGGRGGRGGGGGGRGRPSYNSGGPPSHSNEMESWDNACTDMGMSNDTFPPAEDWDNEEWSGSLADTKVFTPSAPNMGGVGHGPDMQEMVDSSLIMQDPSLDMQHSLQQDSTPDYLKPQNMSSVVESSQNTSQSLQQQQLQQQLQQQQQQQQHLQDPSAVYGYSSNLMGLSGNNNSTSNNINTSDNSVSVSNNTQHHSMSKVAQQNPVVVSGTLSAAQSQYLSQLTQKSSDALKQDARNLLSSQVSAYAPNYGVYSTSDMSSQRKPVQRVRVPPPSKIPSSAVEMPGEQLGSGSTGLLEIQFGALDFPESNTFLSDGVGNDSYSSNTSSGLDHHVGMSDVSSQQQSQVQVSSQHQQQLQQQQLKLMQDNLTGMVSLVVSNNSNTSTVAAPSSQQHQVPSSQHHSSAEHQYSTPTSHTQMLTSESLSAAVAIEQQQQQQQNSSSGGVAMSSSSGSVVSSLNNSSSAGIISSTSGGVGVSNSNNSTSSAMTGSSGGSVGGQGSGGGSSHQQHYASSQQQQSRSQQPAPVSQHQISHLTTVSSLESQLTSGSKAGDVSVQPSVYSSYPGQTYNSKQAYHPTHHAYQTNPYSQQVNSSSFTAASSGVSGNVSVSYPPSNTLNQYQPINTYQNSSVYGNSGLYTASNVPYNSYQALQATSNKISSNVKDSQYDTAVTTATNSLSNTPPTQTVVKTTISSGKSGVSSSVSGVGAGGGGGGGHVGAMVGPYVMGTQPYYQQPIPYPYEDMQMLQQRLPHHMTGYYDMSYTSSRGPPDASIASFPSLTSDARFGRSGGASSPSQQGGATSGAGSVVAGAGAGGTVAQGGTTPTAAQQQGMVAPYTTYYYGAAAMMPAGGYQAYGTPPLYPMATAGGTGSSSYGSGKGGYVGTTYGAPQPQQQQQQQPYDQQQQQPSQQQDYKTGSYSGSQQSSGVKQSGGVNNTTSGTTDLNNSIYGPSKVHVSLGKVNSYEKAAYHSGTPPPPFGLGVGAAGAATVGGGAYTPQLHYIHQGTIPPPPAHQQMEGRVNNSHRRDNGTNSSRTGASGQSKQSAKQGYSTSYWNTN